MGMASETGLLILRRGTDPKQGRGEWGWPGCGSKEAQPSPTHGHTVSWAEQGPAPLPVLSPECSMASLLKAG